MSTQRFTRRLVTGAAVLGAAVGGFAITSTLASSETSNGATPGTTETVVEKSAPPDLLAPTTGREPALFTGNISALQAGSIAVDGPDHAVVTLSGGADGQICTVTATPVGQSHSCYDPGTIQTGLAYEAVRGPDGLTRVTGVVPDDVASVTVNGASVAIVSNVWQYSTTSTELISFTVASADGAIVASPGIG